MSYLVMKPTEHRMYNSSSSTYRIWYEVASIIVGSVHIFRFYPLYERRKSLNKKKNPFIYRIEFDSIRRKHTTPTWYEIGVYRETTYCVQVLSMFFAIGIGHRSAVTAMPQPSTSRRSTYLQCFCWFRFFFAAALGFSSCGRQYGLANAIIWFETPQPGCAMAWS